jgi:hypothetical protein
MPGSGNVGLCLVGIVIEADLITLPHELFEIACDIEDLLLPERRGLRFADVALDEVLNVSAHSVFEANRMGQCRLSAFTGNQTSGFERCKSVVEQRTCVFDLLGCERSLQVMCDCVKVQVNVSHVGQDRCHMVHRSKVRK